MATLSILIPTYNRCAKLKRLLDILDSEVANSGVSEGITVLVSDNASTDKTHELLSSFSATNFTLRYYRQNINLGFDGNIRFLYEKMETEYGWFFSDDDIPFSGAVSKVLSALKNHRPDILLFSFVQPPDSKVLTFNFQETVRVETDPKSAIELIRRYPKISIYIVRKMTFTPGQLKDLEPFLENGFYFLDLAYSVLGASHLPSVAVISEPLAKCDEDYLDFNFVPKVIFEFYKVFEHPFVTKYSPDFSERLRAESYCSGIQFLFAIKTGTMIGNDMELYDRTIKTVAFRPVYLLKNPKSFFQLVLMKLGISKVYPVVKPVIRFVRCKLAR